MRVFVSGIQAAFQLCPGLNKVPFVIAVIIVVVWAWTIGIPNAVVVGIHAQDHIISDLFCIIIGGGFLLVGGCLDAGTVEWIFACIFDLASPVGRLIEANIGLSKSGLLFFEAFLELDVLGEIFLTRSALVIVHEFLEHLR
jgi:hypothetical protein